MEGKFQDTLDSQWDALESRDTRIIGVRKHLGELLSELAGQKRDELQAIDSHISQTNITISKAEAAAAKQSSLQKSLAELENSELPKKLNEIETKICAIDDEIKRLSKQKEELTLHRNELKSIHSSRTAKFENSLRDLNQIHQLYISKLPKLRERRDISQSKRNGVVMELNAATDGRKLWDQVCSALAIIDDEVRGCGRSQLPQISFILDKGVQELQGHLETAEREKWSVLVLAIVHELQLLRETLKAVKQYDKDNM